MASNELNHFGLYWLPKKAVTIINTRIITPIDHTSTRGERYEP